MARRIAGTLWEGVALRRVRAGADPDAPPRPVALPAAWQDEDGTAAAALAALAPEGGGPVSLPGLAEGWIRRLVARGRRLGLLADAAEAESLAQALRALLLARRGAPGAEVWRHDARAEPRFVLNLPAFLDAEGGGFDAAAYAGAVAVGVRALDLLAGGKARRLRLGFADLAGLLAGLGLAYDSAEGRNAAAAVAALTRGAAEAESGRLAARHGALEPVALFWPAPPAATPGVPGLAEAARAALDAAAAAPGRRHAALVALAPPDAVEALLGAETGGLAPAAGATRLGRDPATGALAERPTLAARRIGPARAAALLAPVGPEARRAMEEAVGPFLHADPPAPVAVPRPEPAPLPVPPAAPRPAAAATRRNGVTWRVSVGGHRVALRTTEDAEGGLVEIAVTLSKEGAAFRSLMDALAQSVSLGLARGVPLADYVEAYAYTRFGPAGAVEGDPDIPRATSFLDWIFRRLAMDYLGRRDLPQPSEEDCAPDALGSAAQQTLPLLPLELPARSAPARTGRRRPARGLRVVGG
ncbi:TSCPD domain-containing protein [Caldovatus sediminis]|uniref:TSCPD domain-containing protein n=1 Tax=Caldovatus sediminis TaxID=2041189 RepID=UPI00166D9F94|nr:TSCPD domain-containing protein [Caldovatus sediminis]